MATIKADLYLEDEAPRIGCGWRRVTIEVGRKWMRITELATGKRAKLPAPMLDQMKWKSVIGRP